jgi:putative ABC transport system substrate-binding protein
MVRPGTFIAAEDKQEIDPSLLAIATVVTDITEQACAIGDSHHAIAGNFMTRAAIYAELGEILTGMKPARTNADQIMLRSMIAMQRRVFIRAVTSGLLLGVPFAASSLSTTTVRHIGWLTPGPIVTSIVRLRKAALRELGWIEGQNLLIDYRYGTPDRLPLLAQELVQRKVELIVTECTTATLAAKKATRVTPIVIWSAGDPVRSGLVASLAKPGGNVTGLSIVSPELDAKRLSLLRDFLPGTRYVGEIENSENVYFRAARSGLEETYRSLGMRPIFVEVAHADEFEGAMAEIARQPEAALHVPRDVLFMNNATSMMRIAVNYRLPTIVEGDELLEAGGLLSYDFSGSELTRRGAAFIDKVLRGAKPSDLPMEQPTTFELGVNLKTAKALGIVLPKTLLLRADRVIE